MHILAPQPALANHSQALENAIMSTRHRPRTIDSPLRIVAGLRVSAAEVSCLHAEDVEALNRLSSGWTACLMLDQAALDRLFLLWNTLQQIAADEVSDWSLDATCHISSADGIKPPPLLGVATTVFINGEVSCAVTIDGIDPALRFVETFDLMDLEAPAPAMASSSTVAAA